MRDWVFEDNLRPWLEIISDLVGYKFDSSDWDAVRARLAAMRRQFDSPGRPVPP